MQAEMRAPLSLVPLRILTLALDIILDCDPNYFSLQPTMYHGVFLPSAMHTVLYNIAFRAHPHHPRDSQWGTRIGLLPSLFRHPIDDLSPYTKDI